MEPLTIALPKGRLLEPAANLFRRLGWQCDINNGSRQLLVTETSETSGKQESMRFLLVKPADVPVYVEYGAADVGIVGQDVLMESGRDVYEPLLLGLWRSRQRLLSAQARLHNVVTEDIGHLDRMRGRRDVVGGDFAD